eukprot:13077591-Alexandrium_andersonii.AAC.1
MRSPSGGAAGQEGGGVLYPRRPVARLFGWLRLESEGERCDRLVPATRSRKTALQLCWRALAMNPPPLDGQ